MKTFSLRTGILRIVMGFLIVLFLLSSGSLIYLTSAYRRSVEEADWRGLSGYAAQMEGRIEQLYNITLNLGSRNDLFQRGNYYQGEADRLNRIYETQQLLQMQMETTELLDGIMILYDDVKPALYLLEKSISYADQEMLLNAARNLETKDYSTTTMILRGEKDSYYIVSARRPGGSVTGCVNLTGVIAEAGKDARYGCVMDGEYYGIKGEASWQRDLAAVEWKTGKTAWHGWTLYACQMLSPRLLLVCGIPETPGRTFRWEHLMMLAGMLMMVPLALWVYRFVTRELSVPLLDMKDTLAQLRGGEWSVTFQTANHIQEIEEVRETVQVMLREMETYKNQTYEEQMERQRTQIQYCQLQLAPHFYTNCLKNAYYMLEMKEYDALEHFLLNLSAHMRYLMREDTMMVPLREERQFVENYLELQRQLNLREIDCEIQMNQDLEKVPVPILTLQTFVENSVKYAKTDRREPLHLRINIVRLQTEEGECLSVSCADDGRGYPPELLTALNERDPMPREGMGIGIINLQRRCRFCYGEAASWGFLNMNGAVSELILPLEEEEEA